MSCLQGLNWKVKKKEEELQLVSKVSATSVVILCVAHPISHQALLKFGAPCGFGECQPEGLNPEWEAQRLVPCIDQISGGLRLIGGWGKGD